MAGKVSSIEDDVVTISGGAMPQEEARKEAEAARKEAEAEATR